MVSDLYNANLAAILSVSVRLIENRLTEIFSVNRLTWNIPSREGGNVGRGVPSPSDYRGSGERRKLPHTAGSGTEPRPKMDFMHILGQNEAI